MNSSLIVTLNMEVLTSSKSFSNFKAIDLSKESSIIPVFMFTGSSKDLHSSPHFGKYKIYIVQCRSYSQITLDVDQIRTNSMKLLEIIFMCLLASIHP